MLCIGLLSSCGSTTKKESNGNVSQTGDTLSHRIGFDADSAYEYVARQVAFGPRVPGTSAHKECATWLESELKRHGAEVTVTDTTMRSTDGRLYPVHNITGRFNPTAVKRVMLVAHYDTRPTADEDPDPANRTRPIDGANDGASGTAVILEIARHASAALPADRGLDILFVDTEDSGTHDDDATWCLGSQAYVASLEPGAPRPVYAILLDMVGGEDARFAREYFSDTYARPVNDRIWQTARQLGHGDRFPDRVGGAINDDHVHLLGAGIPTVDIIETTHPETGSFNPTWHTMADNIDNISRETLRTVGRVITATIY